MDPLGEHEFDAAADATLRKLDAALNDVDDGPEVDLESGILTLEFADGVKYVVNSHRAARQIWMAAEMSAWHFDLDPAKGVWIATKTGDELYAALEGVVSRKLGHPVKLPR